MVSEDTGIVESVDLQKGCRVRLGAGLGFGGLRHWRAARASVTVSSAFYTDERSIKADTLAGADDCRAREFDSSRPRQ